MTESIRQAAWPNLPASSNANRPGWFSGDDELERLFVWCIHQSDVESASAGRSIPWPNPEKFLIDSLGGFSMCWHYRHDSAEGFGWDRRTGRRFRALPAPPESTRQGFDARSLLAATLEFGGQPAGRILLMNPEASSRRHSGHEGAHAGCRTWPITSNVQGSIWRNKGTKGRSGVSRKEICAGSSRSCGTWGRLSRTSSSQEVFAPGPSNPGKPHLARLARRHPADALEPDHPAGRAAHALAPGT